MKTENQSQAQQELAAPDGKSMIDVQSARAVSEVQSSMAIAKRFPRDEKAAYAKIMAACARKALAESAIYTYPRGGEKVSGPSIRLAEAVAQSWGNISTGVIELNRSEGESLAMAYCVDLETNYRKEITFAVPHVRDTKQGPKSLTETRDIYELVMNMGSRRLRNAIMAVIPGDIFDSAEVKCMETMSKDEKPLQDRIREMLAVFGEMGVKQEMISAKFGCNVEALTPHQLAKLRTIYQSLKDGMGVVKDFFDANPAEKVAVSIPKATNAQAQDQSQPATRDTKPADTTQKATQAAVKDPDPESFDNFNSAPNPSSRPAETLESLQVDIVSLSKRLKFEPGQLGASAKKMFGKPLVELNFEDCVKMKAAFETDLAKAGVK